MSSSSSAAAAVVEDGGRDGAPVVEFVAAQREGEDLDEGHGEVRRLAVVDAVREDDGALGRRAAVVVVEVARRVVDREDERRQELDDLAPRAVHRVLRDGLVDVRDGGEAEGGRHGDDVVRRRRVEEEEPLQVRVAVGGGARPLLVAAVRRQVLVEVGVADAHREPGAHALERRRRDVVVEVLRSVRDARRQRVLGARVPAAPPRRR
mmetsp:Transcript_8520/g.35092  ORF Transcript_8520/g.35092 Transcript_8520/m.35092 type:complete len:207 (+) Transcript_8520:213-833(+)